MHVSAPGKLLLSGEWAVLETGNRSLVAAIDRRVHANVENSDNTQIVLKDFSVSSRAEFDGSELVLESNNKKLRFAKAAAETALVYSKEAGKGTKTFSLYTWGDQTTISVDGREKKLGFGSSAAATVAIIGGILATHGYDLSASATKDAIYKLSAISHFFAQGRIGSGFDVAASTYGGVFVYSRPDPKWLVRRMDSGDSIKDVVESQWPGLMIEQLGVPEDFHLAVGWTKESASTSDMVKRVNVFMDSSKENAQRCKECYRSMASAAEAAIRAWKKGNKNGFLEALRTNEHALANFGNVTGVNIETEELKKMSALANRCGGAGKLSGAGGGDCGIAVSFRESVDELIRKSWIDQGIHVIDAKLDHEGVRIQDL